MEKCYCSDRYRIYSGLNTICGLLISGILAVIGIIVRRESPLGCVFLLVLGSMIIIHAILFVTYLNRKYQVNENGITIQYANRYTTYYLWENIQAACLGITHRSGTGTTQDVVIWCTTKKRECLPPNESRRHTSWEYDYLHYNSVITIEFSEERYKRFAYYYGKDIPDYR